MESKKDIGKLFKENLDSMDFAPSAKVWNGIEAELKEKKKKRRFFVWFFITIFLVGFVGFYSLVNFNLLSEKNSNHLNKNSILNGAATTSDEGNKKEDVNSISNSSSTNSLKTASKQKRLSKPTLNTLSNDSFTSNSSPKNAYASTNSKTVEINFTTKKSKKVKNKIIKSELTVTNHLASENESNTKDNRLASQKLTNEKAEPTAVDSVPKNIQITAEKDKSNAEIKKDSTAITLEEKSYSVIIAPYYGISVSGKFGNGNSVSSQYTVLDEGGKASQNFGILVRFMGTKKMGLQTGIGIAQAKRFLEVEKNSSFFGYNSNLALDQPLNQLTTELQNDDRVTFHLENSYVEVPLELYYVLADKKLGLASTFGFSIFFLNKNDVYLEADHFNKTRIGSAENILRQHFAINAKLNLFYTLSKRIQLDFIPEFQFQIMSHNNVSNYYPYYLSLKGGISYKF